MWIVVVNCFIFLFDSWMVLLYNRDCMKTTLLTTAVFLGFFLPLAQIYNNKFIQEKGRLDVASIQ